MASNAGTTQDAERKLLTEMKEFPHFTHLNAPGLSQERLRGLLENLEEESDSDDICQDETISKLNFKTWVYTMMDNRLLADEVNQRVISMTNWQNIVSIGNRAFLCWRAGREVKALDCLSKLKDMKKLTDFDERLAMANAELGYSYSRIGGPMNLFKAIELLEKIVQKYPQKFYWKLRLGLVYRRCTHFNIYSAMPKGHSYMECVQKTAAYLNDVIDKSSDNKLRSPAYAELAVLCKAVWRELSPEVRAKIFNNKTAEDLCKEALRYGGDSTWVMTNCGKVWNAESVNILERCLRVKPHTTTHHQLGLCYAWRAEREAKANQYTGGRRGNGSRSSRGQRGTFPTSRGAKSYPPADTPLLKLSNTNYEKAKQEYLKAIKMSHNRNVPAIYSLGSLYKMAGQDDDALERFNQITNNANGSEGHLITIIKAYEQAGLCYLKTGQDELAEDKLTKAISLAVSVASSCPELHDRSIEVWRCFRTMEHKIKTEEPSLSRDKKLIQLLELVKNYKKVVTVVERILDLNDTQLGDPELITSRLNGYLKLNEPEKAVAVLNILSTRPDITSSESWRSNAMIDLRYKVFLLAARYRLQDHCAEARFNFRDLFKLCYGHCAGDVSEDTKDVSDVQDVLLFYDDSDDELSQTSKTVQTLHDVFSEVFGLSTNKNLAGCNEYGFKMSIQLERMKKHQIVIVILGEEERDPVFQAQLEMIPTMKIKDPQTTEVLVIDICHERADVPDVLRQFGCFRIQESMGKLGQSSQGECCDKTQSSVNDIIINVVGKNLDALMQLFCFVIRHEWPLANM